MSVNSSSSYNDSLLHPPQTSTFHLDVYCMTTSPGSVILITYNITFILLLLPLCTFILHHGVQQWWQKRSTSSAVTVSHSDVFTYHMVIMELLFVCGCVLISYAVLMEDLDTLRKGGFLFTVTWYGELLFHILTCVERYLAVVHPITYMNLKTERGIRIRNISIACVWLLSGVGMCLFKIVHIYVISLCVLILSLIGVSFLSLSILCVLIRPGPGERGGDRQRVDQSKLRAFYTVTAILGVLVFRFTVDLVWAVAVKYFFVQSCVFLISQVWMTLPGSLVLPLLFLHRAGKLECCKKTNQ